MVYRWLDDMPRSCQQLQRIERLFDGLTLDLSKSGLSSGLFDGLVVDPSKSTFHHGFFKDLSMARRTPTVASRVIFLWLESFRHWLKDCIP